MKNNNDSSKISATLKELEKKLINVSKRNRLLYTNNLYNKYGVDMLQLTTSDALMSFLLNKRVTSLKLCDLNEKDFAQNKINSHNYNALTSLYREVIRDLREKGLNEAFIAYPFVRGRLLGEDFDINAPLVLFPIKLLKEADCFMIVKDNTRDIIFNTDILVANYKFNRFNKPLPSSSLFEINENDFIKRIVKFYKDEKINLNIDTSQLNFTPYVPPTEQYNRGQLNVVFNCVIGKFNTFSSSIQKDVREIIDTGVNNEILEDLLSGMKEYDIYNYEDTPDAISNMTPKESDLYYITPINSTQENIILATNTNRELVIQGPPGTGKSQVITSIIANAVNKGKSVLMVSEKKSALDVIYSRLGELSKYVLLLDDVNNKENFYNQIDKMLKLSAKDSLTTNNEEINTTIDQSIESIDAITVKMCDRDKYGIEVYKLFHITPKWDMQNPESIENFNVIERLISENVKSLKYNQIRKLYLKFGNASLMNSLIEYRSANTKYPQLDFLKENLSVSDLAMLKSDCEQVELANSVFEKFNISKKRYILRALSKYAKNWFKASYTKYRNGDYFDYVTSPKSYIEIMELYNEYLRNKQLYNELTDIENEYFDLLYHIATEINQPLSEVNLIVYQYILNYYIYTFENENKLILNKIQDYGSVLNKLSELLDAKIKLTKKSLEQIFASKMQNLVNSRRNGDIQRIIDSSRRWSVAKFTQTFFLEMTMSINVWLLTPEVVSEILPLKSEMFDIVIFDEASQMYIEKGIPAVLRAKSAIVVGDSKQLRPSNLGSGRYENNCDMSDDLISEDTGVAALEEESLLDVARYKYTPLMLDFHYRSKYSELIDFSNYAFYNGKLNVSPNPSLPEKPPIEVLYIKTGLWENRKNKAEAVKVVEKLKNVLRTRKNNETIGIITFNSAQRDLIQDEIDLLCKQNKTFANAVAKEQMRKENGQDIGLFVKNIENVQGDERDIIIFSIGYAENENGKIIKNFGWLNQQGGENRLNVAISRAKSKIYIVTSITPNDLDIDNCKNRGPFILKKYLEYAFAISSGNRQLANSILLSFTDTPVQTVPDSKAIIIKQVKDKLVAKGYEVEERIGVGSYTIDLAIKINGIYALGIEFDSTLYNVNINNRERDFHRWKYFNLRGWEIYRIWTSQWWNNSDAEIDKIVKIIDKITD